jgi:hypothetical protein
VTSAAATTAAALVKQSTAQLTPLEQFLAGATSQPKTTGPSWRNQRVVRSDQRNSGYTYNDWRNW